MKIKEYLNIDELIKVIKDKNIVINDEEYVRNVLKQNNYYVIMGYKNLFLENCKYKKEVSFENIYNLYCFDRKLKLLLLNSLLDIENIIKTSITNRFCSIYGFKETDYLDKNNYNINHTYIDKTFNIFEKQIAEKSNENLAISYYKKTYNFIPLWVVSKVLSFGLLKEIYAIMKDDDKKAINDEISNFDDMRIKSLFNSMQLLVDYRNKTAHDEIVYNSKHRKIILSKLKEHKKFILKNNEGLNDLLGVLISIKNILPKGKFNLLIKDIDKLIKEFIKDNDIIKLEDLLKEMNLPNNYLDLKW